jgi:hypothetical protein
MLLKSWSHVNRPPPEYARQVHVYGLDAEQRRKSFCVARQTAADVNLIEKAMQTSSDLRPKFSASDCN